jgi:hypothetical protein
MHRGRSGSHPLQPCLPDQPVNRQKLVVPLAMFTDWASNTNSSPYHPTHEQDITSAMDRMGRTMLSSEEDDKAILVVLLYWPVVWNGLLRIFSKQLTKSRPDSTKSFRRLSSILFPNTCFGTLWSGGLRLLLLTVCGPSDHYSRTVRSCLGLFGLSTQIVRRTQDR